MILSSSWVVLGIVALIAVVVIYKFWKKPIHPEITVPEQLTAKLVEEDKQEELQSQSSPPPMVFATNDNGAFDLSNIDGKLLNIGFGPNPKTYINLLDQAEKDITMDTTGQMSSTVGTTKLYEVAGRKYIVNFTRLTTTDLI